MPVLSALETLMLSFTIPKPQPFMVRMEEFWGTLKALVPALQESWLTIHRGQAGVGIIPK
jgi:hypothetical protein